MDKETVFDILMQGKLSDMAPLANALRETIPHEIIKKPTQELIMFQMEESVELLDFNVGEILVTSCEVRIDQAIGYSMVMDLDEEKALATAFLMAIYEADLSEKRAVERLIHTLIKKREKALAEERALIESTRVNFEVMGGQDPNIKH